MPMQSQKLKRILVAEALSFCGRDYARCFWHRRAPCYRLCKSSITQERPFLATLFAVWLTMNTLLLGVRWRTNLLGDLSGFVTVAFAGWASGITTGAFLSKKINEQLFTKIVNLALVAIGIFMVLQNGKALLGI